MVGARHALPATTGCCRLSGAEAGANEADALARVEAEGAVRVGWLPGRATSRRTSSGPVRTARSGPVSATAAPSRRASFCQATANAATTADAALLTVLRIGRRWGRTSRWAPAGTS